MRNIRYYIIGGTVVNLLIFLFFNINEVQCIVNKINYRWHWILLTYYISPLTILIELLGITWIKKIRSKISIIDVVPFALSALIPILILGYEGSISTNSLSWMLILICSLEVILLGLRLTKSIREKKKLT